MMVAPSKSRQRAKLLIIGVPKTSYHIKIKIKIPNPSLEPQASSKAPNQDLLDMVVFFTFRIKVESTYLDHGCIKDKRQRYQTPVSVLQSPKSGLKGQRCSLYLQSRARAQIPYMDIPKTCDHIQIKIKMPNPSQGPPASSKAPNEDLKDIDILCIFKIKVESQNLKHWCVKDQ